MKQQRLFCEGERRHPAALEHMRRIWHFEFGIDRRPINVGDGAIGEVLQAFESGDEVRGQALYWASLHTYLADRLAANAALPAAVKVVRFEDLCRPPRETLSALFQPCALPASGVPIPEAAHPLPMPTYFRPTLAAA